MVEPSGIGMALFTLRAASDVRAPQFGSAEGDLKEGGKGTVPIAFHFQLHPNPLAD